jgi:hypothetical protein
MYLVKHTNFGRMVWSRSVKSSCISDILTHVIHVRLRGSLSRFPAELIRIWPTELEFRVKGDAAYLALHDLVRSDGEATINGGSCSTLTDVRDRLTFVPIGSSMEGWHRFKGRVSSVFGVHLTYAIATLKYSSIFVFRKITISKRRSKNFKA